MSRLKCNMADYPIKIIFMGTPAITLPAFEVLAQDEKFEILAAYTQPDRPIGRSSEPMPPAVKIRAQKHDIAVYQPEKISETTIEQVKSYNPDLIIVFAYSHIIPKEILDIPKYGCVNIHPSLLPLWRGASPVAFAILNGDKKTGVSYMLMDEKLDHGPIIHQIEHDIPAGITTNKLTENLAILAAQNLSKTLINYVEGKLEPKKQDHSRATISKELNKKDGKIDWHKPAQEIINQINAFTPWPGTYCIWEDKTLKIINAVLASDDPKLEPGQTNNSIVGTGKGNIKLIEVQLEGKKAMPIEQFINGYHDFQNSQLS
jgi:methionyl-tRNA formyltransferase